MAGEAGSVEDVVISASGLTKRFGSTVALDDLTLEIHRGEVFGFLGPNGAGKTTTIRLLLGLLRPTAGSATILGLDVWQDAVAVHESLAYIPADLELWPNLTGAQTIDYLGSLHGRFDPGYRDELIERFDLDTTKKVRAYSRGNRQKVGIIAALMTRADILLLDEPTAGLDPLMEHEFRSCVLQAASNGQTVFLSSHILSEVEALCGRVGILRSGRLVEDGPIENLRGFSARNVVATFEGAPPDVSSVQGVRDVQIVDGRVTCQVHGAVGPLVDALHGSGVTTLEVREPSLEELFLTHYGPGR